MARSDISGTSVGRRIVDNAQSRSSNDDHDVDEALERILSRRTKAAKPHGRAKPKKSAPITFAMAFFKIIIVSGVVIGGIAIIIWMRNFAAENGIIWIGDQ